MGERVGVIGGGAWGTTLAVMIGSRQEPVTLWAHTAAANESLERDRENVRYLPGVRLPPTVEVAIDPALLGEPHGVYVVAVPSAHVRAVLQQLGEFLVPSAAVLSVAKGIEAETHLRMSEVIGEVLPGRRIAALSGPNLAREIAAGKPAGSVIASSDATLAAELAVLLASDRFRVYTNADLIGVELAGALKNVVALAAGFVDGLDLGDSAKAGVITRGLAEITRLGVAAGANPMTFAGLAGVGDLIATCMSPLSRNRRAGELMASGSPWTEVASRLDGVAEGIFSVSGALALASSHGVELPIAEQVAAVVQEGRPPLAAVAELMGREPKDELTGHH
jgi:glycerol-3-phosphate dehydrogenase (NAD(P)+)